MTGYEAICAEAARVGWPVAYKRDLEVHDRDALAGRDPTMPFGWVLRDSGTHIILPETREARVLELAGFTRAFGPTCRWYFWDGGTLRELKTAEALERWCMTAFAQRAIPCDAPCRLDSATKCEMVRDHDKGRHGEHAHWTFRPALGVWQHFA